MSGAAPKGEEADALASAMRSLSNAKRLRLLRFLVEPHYLEDIARDLGVARQSAQEHVDQLLAQGLIEATRGRGDHGPVTAYVTNLPRLFDIYDQLGHQLGLVDRDMSERIHANARTAPLEGASVARAAGDTPRVTIVHGIRIGQTVLLEGEGPWLIGRDPHALLCLDYDHYVSHRHAEIRRTRGGFELADLYSSNGTWLDWRAIPRGGTSQLVNGGLLRVGKSLVLFRTTPPA